MQVENLDSISACVILILILIYLLTAIGLTPGGSSTVHIYTQIIHRITQLTTLVGRLFGFFQTNWEECGPSLPVIPWHLLYK